MAAILGLDGDVVAQACAQAAEGEVVSPANLNAPGQVVIAGAAAAVTRAIERAKALGAKRAIPLQVSAPFHCALMRPAQERLAPELRALAVSDPRVPVVANVDAQPKTDAASAIDALIQQMSAPVRWEDVMRRLVADGVRRFVEVGPGTVLCGLGRKTAREATFTSIEAPEHVARVEAVFTP
jgi:[acyl-carrier-protein] S-malonyltransferase